MPDYEVVMPNPLPFARWGCYSCGPAGSGSGTVYRAPGAAGDSVRDEAYEHMRRTGHHVYYERGTREELHTMATQVPPPPPAEGAEAWCAQTAALGPHRIRYEVGEWMRCDRGVTPLASVCRSGDGEPIPHFPAGAGEWHTERNGNRHRPTSPECVTAAHAPATDWAMVHAAEARVLQQALQLPPPGPDGTWKVQLHTGASAAEVLRLYAQVTEPLFETYPGGQPVPGAAAAAAEAAARDRHDRTHTTAGPTPGCPWCAMAQAGDDDA